MAQIFVSYSRREIRFVEKLAKDLKAKGYDVWFDLTDIEGGERWAQEIQKGLDESTYFVIVISSNSVKSEWVEKEFLYASNKKLKIIPVLFDDCDLPIWLLDIQYIDMRQKRHYQKNLDQIIHAFRDPNPPEALSEEANIFTTLRQPVYLWSTGAVVALLLLFYIFFPGRSPAVEDVVATPQPVFTATSTQMPVTKTDVPVVPETDIPATPTLPPEATVEPSKTPVPSTLTDEHGAEMVLIPFGNFLMGNDRGASDEKPAHIVELDDFYIDKYEVTTAQYRECVFKGPCDIPPPHGTTFFYDNRYDDHPMVFVDWENADRFCSWRDARLPTEAEWEKAARDNTWQTYPWGNTFDGTLLNFCDLNCANSWKNLSFNDGHVMTAPVGSFEAGQSSYGVYDMAGNVSEWVVDWYATTYYADSPLTDPPGAESGDHRVLRGGSWYSAQSGVTTFSRDHLSQNSAFNYIGFRCAKDVP